MAEAGDITIEIGTQGLAPSHLRDQLKLASRVNSRLLRTTTEGPDGIVISLEQMRTNILEVVPALVKHDVFLAIENGKVPASTLAKLIESADSSHVGITLDTVNSLAIPEGTEQVTNLAVEAHKMPAREGLHCGKALAPNGILGAGPACG